MGRWVGGWQYAGLPVDHGSSVHSSGLTAPLGNRLLGDRDRAARSLEAGRTGLPASRRGITSPLRSSLAPLAPLGSPWTLRGLPGCRHSSLAALRGPQVSCAAGFDRGSAARSARAVTFGRTRSVEVRNRVALATLGVSGRVSVHRVDALLAAGVAPVPSVSGEVGHLSREATPVGRRASSVTRGPT